MMYSNKLVCSVKVGGKILRETMHDGQASVFIPFGSEYSLLLKNMGGRNAVVHIEIDGKKVCNGGFYIHSGSTVDIERFVESLQEGRRFKFIEKTKEISDFRGDRIDDGMVRVTWQFEKPLPEYKEVVYGYKYVPPVLHPWGCRCWQCSPNIWYYSTTNTGGMIGSSSGGGGTQSSCFSSQVANAGFSKCDSSEPVNQSFITNRSLNDAGITVEGSKSFQQFHETHSRELESNVHSMVIVLRGRTAVIGAGPGPKVVKPFVVKEKVQCPTCGRKWKSKFEHCGNCGTALKR